MTEKYIKISLDDEKSQYISDVLGNKTCKKILSYLSENEATETDISKALKIPLNTVDYNVKNLIKSGLIEQKQHFWSVKGKKIPSYQISNKQIIISPRKSLKKPVLSAFLTTIITAFVVLINESINREQIAHESMIMETTETAATHSFSLINLNPISWLLIGIWLAILAFITYSMITERKK